MREAKYGQGKHLITVLVANPGALFEIMKVSNSFLSVKDVFRVSRIC